MLQSANLVVGSGGTADLQVQAGSTVAIANETVVGSVSNDTPGPVGAGSIEVSGSGAALSTGDLVVGAGGTGTVTISAGGSVTATKGTAIAGVCNGSLMGSFCSGLAPSSAQGSGTINIGAAMGSAAALPGTLTTLTVTFGDGTTSSGSSDLVFNHTDSNYLFTPVIIGGSATTSKVDVDAGTTVMQAPSDYYCLTTVYSGATLTAGVVGAFSANSNYVVQSTGTMNLQSDNQVVARLVNSGVVNMDSSATAAPGTTLTVNSAGYTGTGTINMNTTLNGDGSPSDMLVINGGTATGTTTLNITNVGGTGALTTVGILVVDAENGATTSATAFKLGTITPVSGYTYSLQQGPCNNPESSQSWYLCSSSGGGGSGRNAGSGTTNSVPTLNPAALALLAFALGLLVFWQKRRNS